MKRLLLIPGIALAGMSLVACSSAGTGTAKSTAPASATTSQFVSAEITGEPVPADSAVPAAPPGPVNAADFRRDDDSAVYFEFRSPSGAIECSITLVKDMAAFSPPEATCVVNGRPAAGTDAACDKSNATGATLWPSKSEYACTVGWQPATTKVLEYGQTIAVDKFLCDSERSGMSCTYLKPGFAVSRAGIDLH